MKRQITITLILAVVAAVASTVFWSCEKEKDTPKALPCNNYATYSCYGIIHNEYLSHVKNSFHEDSSISSLNDCLEFISSFNKAFTDSMVLYNVEERRLSNTYFDMYEQYYNTQELYRDVYNLRILENNLSELQKNKMIYKMDQALIENLLSMCADQYNGKLSLSEYYDEIKRLEKLWQKYSEEGKVSDFSAIVLNIAAYSAQWWMENTEETKVAPWVASDAVGAAYGATVAAVSSYVQNGEINWVSTGVGAVSGAVTGSTGVVGKVGKWISKVLK